MESCSTAPAEQSARPWLDLRATAVLMLLYGAGLRIGEALASPRRPSRIC
jgi:integrase/recombinase XerC